MIYPKNISECQIEYEEEINYNNSYGIHTGRIYYMKGKMNKQDKTNETPISDKIDIVLSEIREILLDKNRKYGNSALEPIGIFAKGSISNLLNVRIDDKLSRIKNQQEDEDEDAEIDLLGYLVLKRISKL